MTPSNRSWLPPYCNPGAFLPAVQESIILFKERPYLFQDFVARAMRFLESDIVRKMGFKYDRKSALPCKWKCSDESLFGVDLCLYAFTGQYPFDKGRIGGIYNEGSLGAAVHHASINLDFGGSHVGYIPGESGGRFGNVRRPLHETDLSTDCGHLMATMEPFKRTYDDARENILLFSAGEESEVFVSIPNEYLQPGWSGHRIKLLIDIERLTGSVVDYDINKPYTHKVAGRTLFKVSEDFLAQVPPETAATFRTTEQTPIGIELTAGYFNIYDSQAELGSDGAPVNRLLPYMKIILSSKLAPYQLKGAVTNTNIEYNKLTDSVRSEAFRQYGFASFTGIFIDIFDEDIGNYINLFQPIGISIKPQGRVREIEISSAEVRHIFDRLEPARPVLPLEEVLAYSNSEKTLEKFTYRPGVFQRRWKP
ncbi:MAG: hypothetical protein JXR49_00025 [Acidobacteria bacterium]|nr:hypothetical protein [Acidobacteriota bacterium]